MKKILIAGDSYGYGQGCVDRSFYYDKNGKAHGDWRILAQPPSDYCYGSLIDHYVNQYNYSVHNFSKPGVCNTYISSQLLDNIDDDTEMVIFSGTDVNRMQCEGDINTNNPFPVILGDQRGAKLSEEYHQALQDFIKYLYHREYFMDVTINAILAVYSACLSRNIKFLWSVITYPNTQTDRLLFLPKIKKRCANIMEDNIPTLWNFSYPSYEQTANESNPYIAPCGHANEQGHKVYFERVLFDRVRKILPPTGKGGSI
jgi:hypothetical protein